MPGISLTTLRLKYGMVPNQLGYRGAARQLNHWSQSPLVPVGEDQRKVRLRAGPRCPALQLQILRFVCRNLSLSMGLSKKIW